MARGRKEQIKDISFLRCILVSRENYYDTDTEYIMALEDDHVPACSLTCFFILLPLRLHRRMRTKTEWDGSRGHTPDHERSPARCFTFSCFLSPFFFFLGSLSETAARLSVLLLQGSMMLLKEPLQVVFPGVIWSMVCRPGPSACPIGRHCVSSASERAVEEYLLPDWREKGYHGLPAGSRRGGGTGKK